jgi:uncharacterized repeat protein (TIGR02543 family)
LTAQWTANSYTVTFDANIDDVTGTMDAQTFTYGTAQGLTENAYTCEDYAFTGWNTQADGTGKTYEDRATVENLTDEADGNVTLYAQWLPKLTVIDPETVSAMYKVEHYVETLDGTYVLEDTDIKFGTLDATVTAEVRSYEHYTVDTERSTLDGTVAMPVIDTNGAVQVLTLKVYYALDSVTVTYDLAYDEHTSTTILKYGASEALAEAPTRTGYTFAGWKLGDITYQPGDCITVTEATTLTALWTPDVIPEPEPSTPTEATTTPDPAPITNIEADSTTTPEVTPTTTPEPDTVNVPEQLDGTPHVAYIIGYPDGTVKPTGNITRAEIAMVFFRLLKAEVREENLTTENSFTDVPEDAWYCEAVSTLAAMGILSGNANGTFDPNRPITRAELATICARFDTSTAGGSSFTDIEGHWAQAYIEKAAALGWIQGYPDGTFRPDSNITRAETMTLINRVLDRTPESEEQFPENMITWPDNLDKTMWYYLDVQEATNTYTPKHKEQAE